MTKSEGGGVFEVYGRCFLQVMTLGFHDKSVLILISKCSLNLFHDKQVLFACNKYFTHNNHIQFEFNRSQ